VESVGVDYQKLQAASHIFCVQGGGIEFKILLVISSLVIFQWKSLKFGKFDKMKKYFADQAMNDAATSCMLN
jgi:hypothetical protein